MAVFRALARVLILILSILWFLTPLLVRQWWHGHSIERGLAVRKRWCRWACNAIGLRVERIGTPYDGPCIYVSNHKCYTDPMIALRDISALPIAKAEIASYPLIGFAGKSTGVVYVKRESSRSRKATLNAMEDIVRQGNVALIYPEGTTTDLPVTMEFKKGGFHLAASAGFTIVPSAIDYEYPEVAWASNKSFVTHFLRIFQKKRIRVKISYGPPMTGTDGEVLMQNAKDWIDRELIQLHSSWKG